MATAPRASTVDRRIVGWVVRTSDDEQLGAGRAVRNRTYEVGARHTSDYWLPAESVAATEDATGRLIFAEQELSLWKSASGRPLRSTAPHPAG